MSGTNVYDYKINPKSTKILTLTDDIDGDCTITEFLKSLDEHGAKCISLNSHPVCYQPPEPEFQDGSNEHPFYITNTNPSYIIEIPENQLKKWAYNDTGYILNS